MDPITIIVFVFLAVSLTIAANRAANALRQNDEAKKAENPREGVSYTGPTYSYWGRERKG